MTLRKGVIGRSYSPLENFASGSLRLSSELGKPGAFIGLSLESPAAPADRAGKVELSGGSPLAEAVNGGRVRVNSGAGCNEKSK